MDDLQRQLDELMTHLATPCISIYMPTAPAGEDPHADRIRFKNLLRSALDLAPGPQASECGAALAELVQEDQIWEDRAEGLAVFGAPDMTRIIRLPMRTKPFSVAQNRFHLKPLLAMIASPGRFYLLALSENANRLLEVTRSEVTRVEHEGLPDSLAEVLPNDPQDKQLQYHTARPGAAVYHGHGGGEYRREEDLRRYLTAVDHGLRLAVADRQAPLVLAGVDGLTSLFRQLSSHPNIVEPSIAGNVERESDASLATRAREVAGGSLQRLRQRAYQSVAELRSTPRVVSELSGVVLAAVEGRVDTLFLAEGEHCWGSFDEGQRRVRLDEGPSGHNEDLLDLAALRTFTQSGMVFLLAASEMPIDDAVAVALLRY